MSGVILLMIFRISDEDSVGSSDEVRGTVVESVSLRSEMILDTESVPLNEVPRATLSSRMIEGWVLSDRYTRRER